MKILFVTDLHGSSLVFYKALDAAVEFDVDLLILGGDLSGKQLLAVIPDGRGSYRVSEPYVKSGESSEDLEARTIRIISDSELAFYCQRLEGKGYYWHISNPDDIERLNRNEEQLLALFEEKISARIEQWAERANMLLPEGVGVIWTGGNDDEQTLVDRLRAVDLGRFICGEGRVVTVSGFEIASLGYSNRTPFRTSRELDEAELAQHLRLLNAQASSPERLLLNVHVPPKACGTLDSCVNPENPHELVYAGSYAVREFIEEVQPLADFAGHVHEGRGSALIGRTRVFNPGSEYNAGIMHGYVAKMLRTEIKDFAHISR